ncbi:MAG: TolB family protein [Candidatus Sumerlaeaceae bacterium]
MSANGRYVAFESNASNLVAGDTNGVRDVFRLDLQTGVAERVSVDSSGVQGNGGSGSPNSVSFAVAISADGTRVAFPSSATNLVAGDTNGVMDAFVRDLSAGTTTRVSVDSSGAQANGNSGVDGVGNIGISISADGTRVAFQSWATNLVPGDTNNWMDIFVRNLTAGTTTRVSVSSAAVQANGECNDPKISGNGTRVAFTSQASNLVTGDSNAATDTFVHDLAAGTTTRVNVDGSGLQAEWGGSRSTINFDGTRVAFNSSDPNLVPGDTNFFTDVFVRDLTAGTTSRVSVDSSGLPGNSDSFLPSLSSDGMRVAFSSTATNLIGGDTNGVVDVYVRDIASSTTTRVSVSSAGVQSNGPSGYASANSAGTRIAFLSEATNLVPGDSNGLADVFVHDVPTGTTWGPGPGNSTVYHWALYD